MKNVIYTCILALLISSCEKDDICADGTAGTPHVIITFHDISSGERKTVSSLKIFGLNGSTEIDNGVAASTTDSIALSLRSINATTSSFRLAKDYVSSSDTGNTDDFSITYTTEEVFISRACGYKSNYNVSSTGLVGDSDNWIKNINVINSTIENETNAHIHIFH